MWVVAGPPGSGKSSLFPLSDTGLDHFNADDRCAELNGASYQRIPPEVRVQAALECEAFVDEHIKEAKSFAVESTFRNPIVLDQASRAKENGFVVHLVFVAADHVDTNIERVIMRARRGGHSAPPSRIRQTYLASLSNLVAALRVFDSVTAYDNSRPAVAPRTVLRMRHGKVAFVADDAPTWVRTALEAIPPTPGSRRTLPRGRPAGS